MAESLASRALLVAAALMLGGCAGGDARTAPVDEVSVAGTGGVARAATTELPAAPPPAVVRPLPDAASASAQPLGGQLPAASRRQTLPATSPTVQGASAAGDAEVPPAAGLSPAVVALINDANQRAYAGQHDGAAASIERALQVDPGNAWLWHRLARERLAQGRAEEAENLAVRSNSLAAGDPRLQAGNWRVIEQSRRRRGDTRGADEAATRASGLERG